MTPKCIPIQIVLLAALLLCSCRGDKTNTSNDRTWKLMEVSVSDACIHTRYSATIQGRQDVEVRPQVSGVIVRLDVNEGGQVKKGQTLFVIDRTPYEAAWRQASANVKLAAAEMASARLNYDGNRELYGKNIVSRHTFQTYENALTGAEARLAEAEAAELSARNSLSYTEVKSPADGVVGVLPYRQGALVSPDITEPLTTVSDNSQMYAYFSIDESLLLSLLREYGSREEVIRHMDNVELILSDGSVYDKKGRIESISGVLNRNTGSVSLRAVFTNPARMLHSGISGNVSIPSVYKDVIVIPQSAAVRLQDKYVVYKVISGKAVSALISVASDSDGKSYIVQNGLEAGDVIVTDGAGLVREGMEIKRQED